MRVFRGASAGGAGAPGGSRRLLAALRQTEITGGPGGRGKRDPTEMRRHAARGPRGPLEAWRCAAAGAIGALWNQGDAF